MARIIAAIETDGPGGAEQMLMRLAAAQARIGIETTVCLVREGWLADQCRAQGLEVHINPIAARLDLGYISRLRALIRATGAVGVHTHEFTCNVHASIAAFACDVPCVATFHGRGFYGENAMRRTAVRLASRLASIAAVSADVREYLTSECGVQADRIMIVDNGIDTERYRGHGDGVADARARLGVPAGAPVIGALGSYYPVKGHRYLVEAMPRILERFPNAQLLLAGQGALAGALEEQAHSLGIGARVRVVGYLDDPSEFLASIDVFVMPSLSEGMPLALLEAGATGLPIIATQVGGMPELVADGLSGLLVPPADPGALATAVCRMLADPALAARCAAEAEARVRDRWSISTVARRYAQLLALEPRGA